MPVFHTHLCIVFRDSRFDRKKEKKKEEKKNK